MDYRDAPEIVEFRAEIRHWLADYRRDHDIEFGPHDHEQVLRWNRDLAAAGYVAVSFPERYGGRGLPDIYDAIVNEELAAGQAPPPPPIGHIAHAISDFGSTELKGRVLPDLLKCTAAWCQGFSEPNAGSDLAGIRTAGIVEGRTIRVTGQKIWTSGAMWSDWCLLLLRTDRGETRHRGLSMVVVDMTSVGISRSRITLSTGSSEFAEVFFDDVEVPLDNLVGELGQGWAIAMHLLSFERGPADMGWTARYARVLRDLQQRVAPRRDGADPAAPDGGDSTARVRVARAAVAVTVLDWHVRRTLANRESGSGAAGSIDKLLATRVEQELYRTVTDLRGPHAVIEGGRTFDDYLYSRAQSIYGGSAQIQRTLVAQRLLGLPRG